MTTRDWRSSPWKRVQIAAIAGLGFPLIAGLGRTLRWRVEGAEHVDAVLASGRQPIFGFWHGRILPATLYFRDRGIVVMTSENFDGEWIARIIERFGYGTARGSTSRGARKAMIRLVRTMASGKAAAFTLDGPRGPARVAQPGAIWLAGTTGNPILPFHVEASSHWTMQNWDRTQIPRPFSTVALVVGPPLDVPSEASDGERAVARQQLEGCLQRLELRALEMVKEPIRS